MASLIARLTKAFARQPRNAIFAEMVVALFVIGFFDYLSGFQIRLLPFYSGPIFVVGWFLDRKHAIMAGLLAGVISVSADWLTHDPDLFDWTGWEIARHIGSCLVVALVARALRVKSDIAAGRIALLEHSQRLEHEIVNISETEQRRIGQELHDGLCQYLAALACSATSLHDDLEKLRLKQEANAAGELAELLQDAVVQTRDLARGLFPAQVGQLGLVLALESLAQSVSRLRGIKCTFEFRGVSKNYDEVSARHLYRIAQEAINNAIRHGKARKIAISLEASEPMTTLRVWDDGVGISSTAIHGSGLGLSIMRYRAAQNGGELHIEEPKSGGTLVYCTAKTRREISKVAAA